jgi:cell division protein FtsI (penicillin-binding protein 3)
MSGENYQPYQSYGYGAEPPAAPRRTERGGVTEALERGRSRMMVAGAVVVLAFTAIAGKLVGATVLADGAEPRAPRVATTETAAVGRADIIDRSGLPLATSLVVWGLHADPALVAKAYPTKADIDDVVGRLRTVFPDLDHAETAAKLSGDKRFVYIKRGLTPQQKQQLGRLGLAGFEFEREVRRVYPMGNLTSHVVGFTGMDNVGLMGIEQKFDARLRNDSAPLQLSVDVRLQHILKREVAKQMTDFDAIGAAGMIYDVRNGEVLAMTSLPDFDPQDPTGLDDNTRFNKNTLGVYEMGSTFKIFNSAMSLDTGKVRLHDSFDATKPIMYGRHKIDDYHAKYRWMTVSEIFRDSSNIGSVRMALTAGIPAQQAFMEKAGMTKASTVELPEVARPLVPHPWREINAMTIAYGHGLSVSPMNTVAAAAATINGGVMYHPTILKRRPGEEIQAQRIISEKTSQAMRKLFRLVVTEGTGKSAEVPGYFVGGKTGTADKQKGRGYSQNSRLSSFVGAFPMHDPRYIVFVLVDEPKGNKKSYGYATAGWVAAPAISRIVRQIAPVLGVPPSDAESAEIRTALEINTPAPSNGAHKENILAAVPPARRQQ